MPLIATKTTRVELNAARTISLNSIRVHSILVSNDTAGAIEAEFTDADDVALISIAVPVGATYSWDVMWMADNGLKVATLGDADVSVTVAHPADGA